MASIYEILKAKGYTDEQIKSRLPNIVPSQGEPVSEPLHDDDIDSSAPKMPGMEITAGQPGEAPPPGPTGGISTPVPLPDPDAPEDIGKWQAETKKLYNAPLKMWDNPDLPTNVPEMKWDGSTEELIMALRRIEKQYADPNWQSKTSWNDIAQPYAQMKRELIRRGVEYKDGKLIPTTETRMNLGEDVGSDVGTHVRQGQGPPPVEVSETAPPTAPTPKESFTDNLPDDYKRITEWWEKYNLGQADEMREGMDFASKALSDANASIKNAAEALSNYKVNLDSVWGKMDSSKAILMALAAGLTAAGDVLTGTNRPNAVIASINAAQDRDLKRQEMEFKRAVLQMDMGRKQQQAALKQWDMYKDEYRSLMNAVMRLGLSKLGPKTTAEKRLKLAKIIADLDLTRAKTDAARAKMLVGEQPVKLTQKERDQLFAAVGVPRKIERLGRLMTAVGGNSWLKQGWSKVKSMFGVNDKLQAQMGLAMAEIIRLVAEVSGKQMTRFEQEQFKLAYSGAWKTPEAIKESYMWMYRNSLDRLDQAYAYFKNRGATRELPLIERAKKQLIKFYKQGGVDIKHVSAGRKKPPPSLGGKKKSEVTPSKSSSPWGGGNPRKFTNDVYGAARKLGLSDKSARILIAHTALSSGWGKGAQGYRLAGVKAGKSWKGDTTTATGWERVGREKKYAPMKWRAYSSVDESVSDILNLLKRHHKPAYNALIDGDTSYFRKLRDTGWYTEKASVVERGALRRLREVNKILGATNG